MSVNAVREYKFEPLDVAANFHGATLVYAGWEGHLMFASPYGWPLPPNLPFGHFVAGPLSEAFGMHPDWAAIDWRQATWSRNGEPFNPDFDKDISGNGLIHKDSLTFRTPNVTGIGGLGI